MKHEFEINGIHCKSCIDKISGLLKLELNANDILFLNNNKELQFNTNQDINLMELNKLLATVGDYHVDKKTMTPSIQEEQNEASYKPIYIIFFYLLFVTICLSIKNFQLEKSMTIFMSGFFLVFSFFKMLDLKGFADGYTSYDLIAKKFYFYGYVYPFIELAFGIGYILFEHSLVLNIAVFVIMLISSLGVIKAKLSKQSFHCACVGTFLKVPLGSIAIIEDISMVIMSLLMIVLILV